MANPVGRPRKESRADGARKKLAPDDYVSQFYIDPKNLDNENYHYRFVETHCMNAETQSLDIAIRAGYEPVALADLPEFAKTAELMASIRGKTKKDEYVRTGDQILMRCPRAVYLAAKKRERLDSKNQMNRLEWAEQAQSIRAPTFISENEYSRTQQLSKAAAAAFADEDGDE